MNASPLGFFERYLSLWVALGIGAGVALGYVFPALFQFIAGLEYASVNLVVAVLIWVMIYPMMVNVDFVTIGEVRKTPKGLIITFIINWLVKPFQHGGARRAVSAISFCVVYSGRGRQTIHCRSYPARHGALHGNGVCVEPSGERQCQLHAGAGVAQ